MDLFLHTVDNAQCYVDNQVVENTLQTQDNAKRRIDFRIGMASRKGGMKYGCLLLLVWFALPVHSNDIEVTIHVDDAYKPFSYAERGEAKGMYIDVLRTAFSRMQGFRVTLKPVPWQRGKQMMAEGKGFGLAPAYFHGHDWPYLYPYSLPFYTETVVAICAEEVLATPRPNWPNDYLDLKIGNGRGYDGWGGELFHSLVKAGKIKYEEAPGSSQNVLKLGAGRVDCIMMESRVFDYELQRLKQTGHYKAGMKSLKQGAVIGTDPVYIGYSRTAREQGKYPFQFEFMQAFDSEIYRMIKSGEIPKIMEAYRE